MTRKGNVPQLFVSRIHYKRFYSDATQVGAEALVRLNEWLFEMREDIFAQSVWYIQLAGSGEWLTYSEN